MFFSSKLRLFFIIVGLFFLNAVVCQQVDIDELINSIPKEDRQVLEAFFDELIETEAVFYSMIGDKPLSSVCIFSRPAKKWTFFQSSFSLHNYILARGWRVWKQHFSTISQSGSFFFLSHQVGEVEELIFINKMSFLATVKRHWGIFKDVVRNGLTPNDFLQEFINEGFALFSGRQDLIGVLYGYGLHNSQLFNRYQQLLLPFKSKKFPIAKSSSEEEELQNLENRLSFSFDYLIGIDRIAPIMFRCDHTNEESQNLISKYKQVRKALSKELENEIAWKIFLKFWIGQQ